MSEPIAHLSELGDGEGIRRTVEDREVAIFRLGSEVYAVDAICPHRRGPLDSGCVDEDGCVICPWHGWVFDLKTGRSPDQPARILTHDVRIDGDDIYVSSRSAFE